MNRRVFLSLLLTFAESSCKNTAANSVINEHHFPADGISRIQIEIGGGQIFLESSSDKQITIISNSPEAASYVISQNDIVLNLINEDSGSTDILSLQIPDGLSIHIKTFAATTHLQGLKGQVEVYSTAGDIQLNSFTGSALLWAGREKYRYSMDKVNWSLLENMEN